MPSLLTKWTSGKSGFNSASVNSAILRHFLRWRNYNRMKLLIKRLFFNSAIWVFCQFTFWRNYNLMKSLEKRLLFNSAIFRPLKGGYFSAITGQEKISPSPFGLLGEQKDRQSEAFLLWKKNKGSAVSAGPGRRAWVGK